MKKTTSYKRVFKACSASICDAIISYESPGVNPSFGECVHLSFGKDQADCSVIITKQGAEALYKQLKDLLS